MLQEISVKLMLKQILRQKKLVKTNDKIFKFRRG